MRHAWARIGLVACGLMAAPGCSIAPKGFADLGNSAPLVRARAATMADRHPPQVVIPQLIGRLDDPDPVVRLTANEELKRLTGKDFGYHAWDDLAERGQAVARWQQWWNNGAGAIPSAQAPAAVAARPRRGLRSRFGKLRAASPEATAVQAPPARRR